MANDSNFPPSFNPEPIITALADTGYAVVDNAIPTAQVECQQAFATLDAEQLKGAGVGPGQALRLDDVRRDKIHWLQQPNAVIPEYSRAMESLRQAANQAFYLGLFDFECHFARYCAGDFYQKHWDAFRGKSNRRLSTIYYLNSSWQKQHAGELVIYDQHNPDLVATRVAPEGGRLVVFFSELFAHEVLPATKPRHSLTGWFRVRES